MTHKASANLLLVLIMLLLPSPVHAWGRHGHEIIAVLAEQRLQPDVREKVTVLLRGTSLEEASTWADQVEDKQSGTWHYVNIEVTATDYDAVRDCPRNQCVIAQIEYFRLALANDKADVQKRRKALKYLIHFVGDLHQPLHAANQNDRGGTQTQVEFMDETVDPISGKPWNLHEVWDSGILERHAPDVHHHVERLNVWLKEQADGAFLDGSVVDWAMESHDLARDHAYVLPEDRKLGEKYYYANVDVVNQQLAKAGVRLASILNEILGMK